IPAVILLLCLAAAPSGASAATPTCRSGFGPGERERATIVGTRGADTLRGTAGKDVIAGLRGADVIRGLGGVDIACGGRGDDVLAGGAGDDTLIGRGGGFDMLSGQGGDDVLRGGRGFDLADYFDANLDEGLSIAHPITVDLVAGTATGQGSDTLRGIDGATGSL